MGRQKMKGLIEFRGKAFIQKIFINLLQYPHLQIKGIVCKHTWVAMQLTLIAFKVGTFHNFKYTN